MAGKISGAGQGLLGRGGGHPNPNPNPIPNPNPNPNPRWLVHPGGYICTGITFVDVVCIGRRSTVRILYVT